MNKLPVDTQRSFLARWLWPTRIGCLLIVITIAILVVIVIPYIPWASSGTIRFPVRVFVFDATQRTPISEATVAVFQSPPVLGPNSLASDDRPFRAEHVRLIADAVHGTTGTDGMAVLEFEFKTSANNTRPSPHAHTRWAWVEVHAAGYGTVVVPVRHDSMKTADMRKLGELLVPVGLVAIEPKK